MDWGFIVKKNFRLNDTNIHPLVRQAGWNFVFDAYKRGIYVLITQGYRSIQEQNEIYQQGRAYRNGKWVVVDKSEVVSNAPGGTSMHNFGLALDFALYTLDGKDVIWNERIDMNHNKIADWMEVVREAKEENFFWGGDFRSFKDTPHFQMLFGYTEKQIRAGARPKIPVGFVVVVPSEKPKVATIVDKKEEEYMIPKDKADKLIAMLQEEWKVQDAKVKQCQADWQAENAKPHKCSQKLDELHKEAEAARAAMMECGELADEVRKASGRKVVN